MVDWTIGEPIWASATPRAFSSGPAVWTLFPDASMKSMGNGQRPTIDNGGQLFRWFKSKASK